MAQEPTSLPVGDYADASLDELRQWRRDCLRQTEEAENAADEARRRSKIYADAGQELEQRAIGLEAAAEESEPKGDAESAGEQREAAAQLRDLSRKNFNTADDLVRLAMQHDQETFDHKSLAMRLTAQIKKRAPSWEDWDL